MARWFALLIAMASVLGQADAAEPAEEAKPQAAEQKEAEYHETLEPLAPYVGHWRGERKSATGELKSIRNDVYKWIHNGRALHLEWTDEAPDGELRASASYIFYWDGADQKIKFLGTGTYGIIEKGTLVRSDETGIEWEVTFVFASGNQGFHKFKTRLDEDGNGLVIGWSKITGSGPNEMGPFSYQRVK